MNDFLTSRFPHSYAKIYNGMLDRNGSEFISKYLMHVESKITPDKFIEQHATSRPTDRVYDALKEVYDVWQAGYVQLLEHLKKDVFSSPLRKVQAIILQVDENERWKMMFDAGGMQFDLLLAIPSIYSMVSVSTSKIESNQLERKPKPFDVLEIGMYGFYDAFNKLHGSSHRSVTLVEQSDTQRANTFDSIKFALRTLQDAQKLSNCANMRLYASFSGHAISTLGFYFLCICKITSSTDANTNSAVLFNLEDESSSVKAVMDSDALALSIDLAHIPTKIGICASNNDTQMENFADYTNTDYSFLLSCYWPLGSKTPQIICALALDDKVPYQRLYAEALVNTRRKIKYTQLEEVLVGSSISEIIKDSSNLVVDKSNTWVYYKDSAWDGDALSFLVERDFKKPTFSEILKSDLSNTTINECQRQLRSYFKHHEYAKNLYLSDDPENDFALSYAPIDPHM